MNGLNYREFKTIAIFPAVLCSRSARRSYRRDAKAKIYYVLRLISF
jgi:hypothetical protein